MALTYEELTNTVDNYTKEDLIGDWRWLVSDAWEPVTVTKMGDLFLLDESGKVHFLDSATGQLSLAASSVDEFHQLAAQPDKQEPWFKASLVEKFRAAGIPSSHRQVYSLDQPAIKGGTYDPENIIASDAAVHLANQGQLLQELKNQPAAKTAAPAPSAAKTPAAPAKSPSQGEEPAKKKPFWKFW